MDRPVRFTDLSFVDRSRCRPRRPCLFLSVYKITFFCLKPLEQTTAYLYSMIDCERKDQSATLYRRPYLEALTKNDGDIILFGSVGDE